MEDRRYIQILINAGLLDSKNAKGSDMTMNIIKTAENLIVATERQLRTDEAIHNINKETALPRIYVFSMEGNPGEGPFIAMAEDGAIVGNHYCSSEAWACHDLISNLTPNHHFEEYKRHYPNGFEMEFCCAKERFINVRLAKAIERSIAATQVVADQPSDEQIIEQAHSYRVGHAPQGTQQFRNSILGFARALLVSNAGKASSDQIAMPDGWLLVDKKTCYALHCEAAPRLAKALKDVLGIIENQQDEDVMRSPEVIGAENVLFAYKRASTPAITPEK